MNIPQLVERKFLFASDQPITAPLYEIVIAQNGVFKRARRTRDDSHRRSFRFRRQNPGIGGRRRRSVELTEKIPAQYFRGDFSSRSKLNGCGEFYRKFIRGLLGRSKAAVISGKKSAASVLSAARLRATTIRLIKTAFWKFTRIRPAAAISAVKTTATRAENFACSGFWLIFTAAKPSIRLRVGVYDSFWEIPVDDNFRRAARKYHRFGRTGKRNARANLSRLGRRTHKIIFSTKNFAPPSLKICLMSKIYESGFEFSARQIGAAR